VLSRYLLDSSLGAPRLPQSDVGNISCSEQPLVQSETPSLLKVIRYESVGEAVGYVLGTCVFARCSWAGDRPVIVSSGGWRQGRHRGPFR
jgi:hypothetical protein